MGLELVGILAALGSAATWAVGALMLKPFAERLPAMGLAFAKGVFGLVLLGGAMLLIGSESITWPVFSVLFLSGVLGIGVADTLFFKALRELSSHSVVQLMLLGQVATIGMAVVFLGEMLGWLQWVGVALVILGVAVVLLGPAEDGDGHATRRGVFFGLVSVLSMAASVTMAKGVLDEVDALTATFLRISGGVVSLFLLAPLFYLGKGNWLSPLLSDWRLALRFCAIATFVTFGGFFLSLLAMKLTPLAIANTLLSTEPLFVLLIMAIFYRERPDPRRLAGSLIGVLGVGFISAQSIMT
ncbi:EamA family transporter [Thiorhodococcus minor]|uniref:DMT family transporter n=1 Tax=Thiorhodococcus minor TaxID=57489 RepID=A0A6M0JXI8_9GAMM|nr:DMT family transporter [Thiorhodococcus minor]